MQNAFRSMKQTDWYMHGRNRYSSLDLSTVAGILLLKTLLMRLIAQDTFTVAL